MAEPHAARRAAVGGGPAELSIKEVDDGDAEEDIDEREHPEGRREVRERGHGVAGAERAVDDEWLAAELGDEPAGLQGDEAEGAREHDRPEEAAVIREALLAPREEGRDRGEQ